ncbi:MAG: TlpA family protein disulfide reductase [Nitrospirae bacterium]|nr:MAG: TlpA family protein disulfide reductase [Nitrospirota bacterium]
MPSLERLKQRFSGLPLEILTIDVGEDERMVSDFIRHSSYTFQVLLDKNSTVSAQYNVRAHPKTFLIDPSGRVVAIAEGYRRWDSPEMLLMFKKILNKNA